MKRAIQIFYRNANGDNVESTEIFEGNKEWLDEQAKLFISEWIDVSNGTGYILVGDPTDIDEVLGED